MITYGAGYTITERTPRSLELTRLVVIVYELTRVADGQRFEVEESVERRTGRPGQARSSYIRLCSCESRFRCAELDAVEEYRPFANRDPDPTRPQLAKAAA